MRDGLYRAMQDALRGRAGIPWDDCGHEDHGDGVFVLVPCRGAESLAGGIAAARAGHGATCITANIRGRSGIPAADGFAPGRSITTTRVAPPWRSIWRSGCWTQIPQDGPRPVPRGMLAVIVSSWFFEEVVRHSRAVPGYRPGRGGGERDHHDRLSSGSGSSGGL